MRFSGGDCGQADEPNAQAPSGCGHGSAAWAAQAATEALWHPFAHSPTSMSGVSCPFTGTSATDAAWSDAVPTASGDSPATCHARVGYVGNMWWGQFEGEHQWVRLSRGAPGGPRNAERSERPGPASVTFWGVETLRQHRSAGAEESDWQAARRSAGRTIPERGSTARRKDGADAGWRTW